MGYHQRGYLFVLKRERKNKRKCHGEVRETHYIRPSAAQSNSPYHIALSSSLPKVLLISRRHQDKLLFV